MDFPDGQAGTAASKPFSIQLRANVDNCLQDAPPNRFRISFQRWQELRGILRNTALWDTEHPRPSAAQRKTKWLALNEFEKEDGLLYKSHLQHKPKQSRLGGK